MINDKFRTWWATRDDVERCKLIKDKSIEVNRNHKSMDKANKAVLGSNSSRSGVSGGKFTTLQANLHRHTKSYLDSIEELKYMVSRL